MNKELAYILGIINVGDGWISYDPSKKKKRYCIGMVSIDNELVDYFSFCCQKALNKVPSIYLKKTDNPNWNDRYYAYLSGKEIVKYFLSFAPLSFYRDQTCQIIPCVFHFSSELKASYLQAFFDSQGSVYTTNNTIVGVKKQQEALVGIQKLLISINIKSSVKKGAITICNKAIPSFMEQVGFKCQRKQNKLSQIPLPFYQRSFTEEEIEYIIKSYKNISWRKIAQSLNCSKGAVQYRIKKHCKNIS